jgi:hypothetical protein
MDANGSRSKAVARLLKKLGVQASFECFLCLVVCWHVSSLLTSEVRN